MGPPAGSRLESVNVRLGMSILVGDATYQQAKEAMSLSSLGTWAGGGDHTTNRLKRILATEPSQVQTERAVRRAREFVTLLQRKE
jgi:hypothetical protein